MYVPLWCKSNFSFLEGASHPEELVEKAQELGLEALALTDRDGVYGVVEAYAKAKRTGLKLIVGAEVTIDDGSSIPLLAIDRKGYANLCSLLTIGRRRCEKGESLVRWREVCEHAQGLLGLWGGARSLLVDSADPHFVARELVDAFGDRLYALVTRHLKADEPKLEARLRERARKYGLEQVAGHEVLYHTPARRDLQDVLSCIRHGVRLSDAGCRIRSNAEHGLKSTFAFSTLFEDDPASVARTREIALRCRFSLGEIRYRYPLEKLPDGQTASQWLRRLTFEGARLRYDGSVPNDVDRQLRKELELIEELDYGGYFLTMWEIVRFCKEQEILCQGRGSAANSAVCYCLGITAVDPVRMELLFERFLSRERAEPPDIDLDIEHERREEVIQHVYAKYGRTHAAMVANYIRYRAKSAIRDVGKALGISETALDRMAKTISSYSEISAETLTRAGLETNHEANRQLLRLSNEILDFPRHLSIHPGGFLLDHEPVSNLVPIENASMPDRTVIQWDKDSLEELGLFKVDLLGLGALHQLHLGFDLLRRHHGQSWSMATVPADDEETFDAICAADTVGVFQIESRAQMAMLPRLRPRTYYDLVIEVSIVRPGPITGGMVHPYLRRRSGEEPVEYPHECLEPVLRKTLGVPLFQEQVIRLAMVAADYTPGEADQLRRDMAAWRRSGRIERHRTRLVERMMSKGIKREFAERVFEQIRGFGEYGFPESHAASFALIANATAWMKHHYPEVFACSLLNAQPMGFYAPSTIMDDAKRHDVEVRPIDANASDWDCTLEPGADGAPRRPVRIGFRYVKSLGKEQGARILAARRERTFGSLDDFLDRVQLPESTLESLAEAGVFDRLVPNRRQAIWHLRGRTRTEAISLPVEERGREPVWEELSLQRKIAWDYRTTQYSVSGHPLSAIRGELRSMRLPDAAKIRSMSDGRRVRYAGLVICRQRPGTASGVVFMTLEDETGFVNLVIWSRVFEDYALLLKTTNFLGVTGKLQVKDGVTHLIAEAFWVPAVSTTLEKTKSRDFH